MKPFVLVQNCLILKTRPGRSCKCAPNATVVIQVWSELLELRRLFLTQRCVAQYLGFIADRLRWHRQLSQSSTEACPGRREEISLEHHLIAGASAFVRSVCRSEVSRFSVADLVVRIVLRPEQNMVRV